MHDVDSFKVMSYLFMNAYITNSFCKNVLQITTPFPKQRIAFLINSPYDYLLFLLILLLLAFTTHLRALASLFLRFRDHTQ
jgi:hypothetical protein